MNTFAVIAVAVGIALAVIAALRVRSAMRLSERQARDEIEKAIGPVWSKEERGGYTPCKKC